MKLSNFILSTLVFVCSALSIVGCSLNLDSNVAAKIAVQYATIKVVNDSEKISSSDVLIATDKVRSLVNGNDYVTSNKLLDDVIALIGIENLSPQDQFLVATLLNQIEMNLSESVPSDFKLTVNTLLDWIEQSLIGMQ